MKNTRTFYALSLLVALGIIWGSGYSIAKFAMENGVQPIGYAFWQSLGPAILISIIALFSGQFIKCNQQHLRFYFISGLLGIAIPNTNMYFIAPHIPAGILAVIVNTVPILTYPLAILAQQEYFKWSRFFAVIIGFIGILLIVLPHKSLPDIAMTPWALLALVSPLSFALCAIYINRARPQNCSALTASQGMLISSSLLLIPLTFISHQFYVLTPPFSIAGWIVILEIILSSIGYVLFFILLRTAGAVYYSMVGGIVSITGLIWAGIIFHEIPNYWSLLATICIVLAIALMSFTIRIRQTLT
ncbi:MAG: multidrug ABC transporter permease [Legionellales bacterium]|nr:multidrug ABC transporter permease [Legionellales bacterium]